jgi:hypothetical protein
MSIILEMLGAILLALIRSAIEVPFIWLGEIVRWAITLGRYKPVWDCHLRKHGGAFVLISEISFWIGAVTAAGIGLLIKYFFFTP